KKTTTTILALLTLCALNANAQGPQGLQGSQGPRGPQGPQGLRLAELQQAAVAADPRFAQISLQQAQADLRLGNISAERKPSISVEGQIQFQSDVPTPPPFFPGGQ